MIPSFTKQIFIIALLVALMTSSLLAQKSDYLSMSLNFNDSIVYVNATYQTIIKEKVDSVYFLLNPDFELDTIKSENLISYKITQKEGVPFPFFHLKFNDSIDVNEKLIVDFVYKIDLSKQNHMQSNWIELNVDKLWFPNMNSLNNKFTYEVSITNFPKSYHLITHTDAKVTEKENQIFIRKDTPWYEVLILAGHAMKEWKHDENITFIGSENITDSTIQSLGYKVKNSIDKLNGYFGMSDPIKSFKVVLRNTKEEELGFQFNRSNMIVTGTDFNDYGNLSHEIAHFWWSKANFIDEPWMNESFANFSMYLVLKEYDFESYKRILARSREVTQNAIPVIDASLFAADAYNSYYHKGALHLVSLEDKIGSELMRKLLSSCVEKEIKTTDGFLMELEKLTNKEERNFFEELLKI